MWRCQVKASHMWRRLWMSHTCEGAFQVTHMNESHMWSRLYQWAFEWVTHVKAPSEGVTRSKVPLNESHIWMSHTCEAACMNGPFGVRYECVSHMWIRPVTHVNESCRTCACVMSHTHMDVTHTYEKCMPHIGISHVTIMTEACHTYERLNCTYGWSWGMLHKKQNYATHMTHSYAWDFFLEACYTYKRVYCIYGCSRGMIMSDDRIAHMDVMR